MRMIVTVAVHVQVMLLLCLMQLLISVPLIRSSTSYGSNCYSGCHKSVAIGVRMMGLMVSRTACIVKDLGRLRDSCRRQDATAITIGIGIALDEALRAEKYVCS